MLAFSSKLSLFVTIAAAFVGPSLAMGFDPTATTNKIVAREGSSFNPMNVDVAPLHHAAAVPETNARRMARGLAPNRPRFRRKTSRNVAARAVPSSGPSPCQTITGILSVGGGETGYVSRTANTFGEYGLTADASEALTVQYQNCAGTGGPVNLVSLNGLSDYPYVGGITGFADTNSNLDPGSFNYAYIGGIATDTPPDSAALTESNAFSAASNIPETVETAIWQVDPASGAVTAQWVNTDGSTPTTYIVYVASSQAYALTGDINAFVANFGLAPTVSFTFVQS